MELDKNANLNASPFFSLEEIYITDINHTSLELNTKTSKGKKKCVPTLKSHCVILKSSRFSLFISEKAELPLNRNLF